MEVIVALNERWTLAGATLMEWMSGFIMFILCSELTPSVTRSMPILLLIMVGTAFGLAGMRKKFPDEERGVRNWLMSLVGKAPIGIPAPSALQPYWSSAPIRKLKIGAHFDNLNLNEVINEHHKVKDDEKG